MRNGGCDDGRVQIGDAVAGVFEAVDEVRRDPRCLDVELLDLAFVPVPPTSPDEVFDRVVHGDVFDLHAEVAVRLAPALDVVEIRIVPSLDEG